MVPETVAAPLRAGTNRSNGAITTKPMIHTAVDFMGCLPGIAGADSARESSGHGDGWPRARPVSTGASERTSAGDQGDRGTSAAFLVTRPSRGARGGKTRTQGTLAPRSGRHNG